MKQLKSLREVMGLKKKSMNYVVILLFLIICCVFVGKKIINKDHKSDDNAILNQSNEAEIERRTKVANEKAEKVENVWDKVALTFCPGIEGVVVHEPDEEIQNHDWAYQFSSAHMTKKMKKSWNFREDWQGEKIDKKRCIKNKYTYVYLTTKICCLKGHDDFGINNISLNVFDEKGENMDIFDVNTGNLPHKNDTHYWICKLKKGETMETEFAYAVPDKYLNGKYYFALQVDNQQVRLSKAEEVALIKLDIQGIEQQKG